LRGERGRRGCVDPPYRRLGQIGSRQAGCISTVWTWWWARGFLLFLLCLLESVLLLLDHVFGQRSPQSTCGRRVCRTARVGRSGGKSTCTAGGCCLAMVVHVFWRRCERGSCIVVSTKPMTACPSTSAHGLSKQSKAAIHDSLSPRCALFLTCSCFLGSCR
jgi:hypothetical protein